MPDQPKPIRHHPDNPRYFLYRDTPLVLITATEHYGAVINRNFDYIRYLDDTAARQLTLSRCFLLFRELQVFDPAVHEKPLNPHSPCKPLPFEYVSPYSRTGPGFAPDGFPRFDLDQWNSEFFERLHGFLSAAEARNVIVELTLFSCTYHDAVWRLNPLHIENNINGVGDVPWQDYTSMRDTALFERQVAYVRKIVQEVNRYDNIYFEICNEPFAGYHNHATVPEVEAWHQTLRDLIREEEANLPKQHLIFQCPVENWRTDHPVDHLIAEPTIDAINLHDYMQLTYQGQVLPPLARFMQRDLRLWRINHLWTAVHPAEKPFVFDEDNAATNALDEEAWIIHRKRAWAVVCGGGHYNMIDFSIQVGGQETGTPESQATIRSWLKHLSTFIHNIDFVHMAPAPGFVTAQPEATLAMTLANAGQEYVVYLADCREVDDITLGQPCAGPLALTLPDRRYQARLYSPADGCYLEQAIPLSGGAVTLELEPFVHDIVVHIQAFQAES